MSATKETILVAMSGGVDSSVAAARLLEQGHSVIGVFMRNGVSHPEGKGNLRQGCCSVEDAMDARRVADRLDVPFYALDLADAFDGLIDDFVGAYALGRTPNPCIECNKRFKMGALRKLADQLGASAVATGHYARIVTEGGRLAVARGVDQDKDQSYVLFSLDQDALAHTRLPLGKLTKAEVREEARRFGLRVAEKAESMDICFVPTGDYRDVLRARRPELLVEGPIIDETGHQLGTHDGTASYTIGQRRRLPGGQPEPLYVTGLDVAKNTVIVGPRSSLLERRFTVREVTWSGVSPGKVGDVFEGTMKIRHQHRAKPARVTVVDGGVNVELVDPESAITPGQAAVLYDGDRILLGGWIETTGDGMAV